MTANECLEHVWLRRKPPVKPPVKPDLDVTKDNLRMFVERWAEHPNSPYLFDVSSQIISPIQTNGIQLASSHHSLRGMSPSPCGSLNSSLDSLPDFEISNSPSDDNVFHHYTFDTQQEFQTFERRASDSSCFMKKTDIAERVNLAEEIRKLSDKLFKMSTMSDFTVPSLHNTDANKIRSSYGSSLTAVNNNHNIPIHTSSSNVETQRNLEDNKTPWRRTKYNKINEMSRDVPISTYSKTVIENGTSDRWNTNGTNALGTKDLLLKLLDKWDDDTHDGVRTPTGRHMSVSTEWSEVESLGQRTISSLNTFFQSRTTTKKTSPFLATNGVK